MARSRSRRSVVIRAAVHRDSPGQAVGVGTSLAVCHSFPLVISWQAPSDAVMAEAGAAQRCRGKLGLCLDLFTCRRPRTEPRMRWRRLLEGVSPTGASAGVGPLLGA